MTWNKREKKRQGTYIAPLQPPTLATFLSWGSSAGAGRISLAGCKCRTIALILKHILKVSMKILKIAVFWRI